MLTLTRKIGEAIDIGHDVRVVVSKIDRGKVRLSIAAPREKPITRTELLERSSVHELGGEG